jgi:WD40 repeat protein
MENDKVDLDNEKPYPGPVPFQRKDQSLFFGREHEADELVSLITAHPVVLLYSQSGAGKTSLLNAGLIPLLETLEFKVVGPARVRGQIPEGFDYKRANPYLYNALHTINEDSRVSKESTLNDYLQATLPTDSKGQLLQSSVVVFDQFEELFTLNPELWQHRADLFTQIGEALTDSNLRVLFVMREDFIAEMDPYEALLPEKLRTRFRLERLRQPAALAAIKGPLGVEPWKELDREFGEGVAEALVENLCQIPNKNDIDGRPLLGEFIEPVQLQVVCQAIWEKLESKDRVITQDHLQRFGDVNQALTLFYEECLERALIETNKKRPPHAPELHEGALRGWFDRELITETGKRSTVFRGVRETGGIPNDAIDELEARHIIRAELRDGERWYELSHDRFLQPIKESYKRWLLDQPGSEQTRLRLEEKAAKWFDARKDASLLLDAGEVPEARRWLDSPEAAGVITSDRLLAFVSAGEAAIERAERARERELASERQRRMKQMRFGLVAMAVLVILMAAVAAYAMVQRQAAIASQLVAQRNLYEARVARAEALDARALAEERRLEAETQEGIAETAQKNAEDQTKLAKAAQAAFAVVATRATTEANAARKAETEATAQRSLAESRLVSSVATNLLSQPFSDPEVAALLGLEAANLAPTDQALDALRSSVLLLTDSRAKMVGHTKRVNSAAFSPDGKLVVTSSDDGSVRLWNPDGTLLRQWAEAQFNPVVETIGDPTFSPDGRFIVAAKVSGPRPERERRLGESQNESISAEVIVLDAHTLELVTKLNAGSGAKSASTTNLVTGERVGAVWSPDGKRLLVVGFGAIYSWDMAGWRVSDGFPFRIQNETLRSAKLSSDGNYAFIKTDNPSVDWRVIDLASKKEEFQIPYSTGIIPMGIFSPDNKLLATMAGTGKISVWDWKSGRRVALNGGVGDGLGVFEFSRDGRFIAAGSVSGVVSVWKIGAASSDYTEFRGHDGPIESIAFDASGKLLLTASADGTTRIWDVSTGNTLAVLRGHTGPVSQASFSPDGSLIATASSDGTARVWEAGRSGEVQIKSQNVAYSPQGHFIGTGVDDQLGVIDSSTGRTLWTHPCFSFPEPDAFSPDDKSVALICGNSKPTTAAFEVYVFDAYSGAVILEIESGEQYRHLVFSPNGKSLLGTDSDGRATLWDPQTGKTLREFGGPTSRMRAVFSPDGKFVAGESKDEVLGVWNVDTGVEVSNLNLNTRDLPPSAVFFSPDGKFLVVTAEDRLFVWKFELGTKLELSFVVPTVETPNRETFTPRSFSPDGRLLVAPAGKDAASIVELESGKVIATLSGHTGAVVNGEFSKDGRYVVTASTDGTARVWSTSTWKSVTVLRGHKNALKGASFGGPDGRSILTWSSDDTARVYAPEAYGTLKELRTLAEKRIVRNPKELTTDERRQYLGDLGLTSQPGANKRRE